MKAFDRTGRLINNLNDWLKNNPNESKEVISKIKSISTQLLNNEISIIKVGRMISQSNDKNTIKVREVFTDCYSRAVNNK